MAALRWVLLDEAGAELRTTEDFGSQAEAERWLAAAWQGLVEEGAAAVSLRSAAGEIYEMSLAEG